MQHDNATNEQRSESKSGTLSLLLTTKLEVLAALQRQLHFVFAHRAFQPENDLLRCFSLLVEDRLCLTTVTRLLPVVTTLSLREQGVLALLVLGNLVRSVLFACLALAVSPASLGNVDHLKGGDDDDETAWKCVACVDWVRNWEFAEPAGLYSLTYKVQSPNDRRTRPFSFALRPTSKL